MIDRTFAVELDTLDGMDLEDQLDALLAVADDDRLALCERCLCFVDADDAGTDEATGETICAGCHVNAEAATQRTMWDPQLRAWHDERERRRAAMPVPDGLDGVPF